ncbi:MAG: autotransporter-associated beta strand repeat-containing protein [Anaerolineae bacterium]|nr:autotransporter-associated beta strand repeat-containing protein [Phycisphaerae bacterium]
MGNSLKRLSSCLAITWLALGSVCVSSASAQTSGTWLGAGGMWSDPNLWTSKPQFPSNGGEATFISQINSTITGTITLDTSVQLSRLITSNTRYMQLIEPVNGHMLEFVGPAEVRVDDPLIWIGGFFWPRPGFWLKGGVSGNAGLTKTGAGEIALSETNSFTGGLRINGGTVFARHDTSLGAANESITINGGTLSSFSNPIPLDTSRTIHIGANGGTFHSYASAPVFRGDMTGDSTATFQSTLLVENTSIAFRVLGDQSFTGDVRVFTRADSVTSTGTLAEAGAWRHARSLQIVGRLAIDNSTSANSDRLSDGTVTIGNGTMLVTGNTATAINEHAGPLVADGFGHLAIGTAGAQPVNLTFSRLETRRGGAISVGTLNGGSTIRFDQAPTLIGSGTHGITSAPIAPGLSVTTLHTYDGGVGVRRLNSNEYLTTLPSGASTANERTHWRPQRLHR